MSPKKRSAFASTAQQTANNLNPQAPEVQTIDGSVKGLTGADNNRRVTTVIHCGDIVDVCKQLQGARFHAVLCDPPYGYEFMGKDWDKNTKFKEWGEAIMPLLCPGALGLMFGGTRTWYKLATGMEDAGFELIDTLMWLYGQGFPKAYNVANGIEGKLRTGSSNWNEWQNLGGERYDQKTGYVRLQADQGYRGDYSEVEAGKVELTTDHAKAWAGYKSPALKPGWEPCLMFRAPRHGVNYVDLALEHGSGCLNIDGCRIPTTEHIFNHGNCSRAEYERTGGKGVVEGNGIYHKYGVTALPKKQTSRAYNNGMFGDPEKTDASGGMANDSSGRYPANVILDPTSAAMLDEQAPLTGACAPLGSGYSGESNGKYGDYEQRGDNGATWYDEGRLSGASRFFFCAKASGRERNAGLEKPAHNDHPCVKPLDLCRYLATLILPPPSVSPRRLLVPFCGSGSEMIGAVQAGWDEVVGIEISEEYAKIARRRLAYYASEIPGR